MREIKLNARQLYHIAIALEVHDAFFDKDTPSPMLTSIYKIFEEEYEKELAEISDPLEKQDFLYRQKAAEQRKIISLTMVENEKEMVKLFLED